ncbi:lipoprotein BUG3 [Streptococcus sp. HMSC065E03]|uniref:lipoprotein BUG3 n=1 Tax=Streptococcus TaxID=1301 RepID=UPI0008A42C55|nr:lipoprotein BUG3 [Streptococcus sp. HMSC065E03]MBN2942989.1 lipoprotein BUG3 [Streptococcus sp.]
MKSRKIMMIGVSIAVVLCIVGCAVKQKEDTKQDKTNVSSSIKEDKKAIKQKQLAILKEHEQEIVDFVKAQNPKVESVQIYWDETEWGVAGNGTPQGGDEMILIFGGFNQNPESSWRVDLVVEDGKINLKTMSLGQNLSID